MDPVFDNNLKIKDALQIYFSKYHFTNGGYDLKWFEIKIGDFFIPLPNTKARADTAKIHDIHHVVTEYGATLKEDIEIAAWEIASGCGKYYIAWLINFGLFLCGIFLFPRSLLLAFLKGKSCITNFYYNTNYDENLLNKTVGELRKIVGMEGKQKNPLTDYLWFILYCLLILSSSFIFFYTSFILLRFIIQSIFRPY